MITIGLTGPSGAGKGLVASLLTSYGIPVLDTDAIYHQLLRPPSACLDELVTRFGASILSEDGTLDRPALAAIVFSDTERLHALNEIAHRHVMRYVRTELSSYAARGTRAVAIDAPQLFEAGADADCDFILAVLADAEVRERRVCARDGISPAHARARFSAQKDDEFFRSHADAVLENNGAAEDQAPALRRILLAWGVPIS